MRLSLPWSIMDTDAYKDFWKKVNYRNHLKHSRTFARRKLPELYRVTKIAVDELISKNLRSTTGVLFICDHWTSLHMDAYIGFTLHMISKEWKMNK